jgi:hypothetical protein
MPGTLEEIGARRGVRIAKSGMPGISLTYAEALRFIAIADIDHERAVGAT